MEERMTLDRLAAGQRAAVVRLCTDEEARSRLVSLGFVPGSTIQTVQESPWGDPVAYYVCGAVIALRRADARRIEITAAES